MSVKSKDEALIPQCRLLCSLNLGEVMKEHSSLWAGAFQLRMKPGLLHLGPAKILHEQKGLYIIIDITFNSSHSGGVTNVVPWPHGLSPAKASGSLNQDSIPGGRKQMAPSFHRYVRGNRFQDSISGIKYVKQIQQKVIIFGSWLKRACGKFWSTHRN